MPKKKPPTAQSRAANVAEHHGRRAALAADDADRVWVAYEQWRALYRRACRVSPELAEQLAARMVTLINAEIAGVDQAELSRREER